MSLSEHIVRLVILNSPDARKKPPPALYNLWLVNGAAQMMKNPPSSTAATPMSIKMLQNPL